VLEGSWRELVEPLRDGEIDMIVGALRPFDIADLYQMPLYEDRLVMRREASIRWPSRAADAGATGRLSLDRAPANSPLREQWEQFSTAQPRRKRRSNAGR
jgi:hypothetical protein